MILDIWRDWKRPTYRPHRPQYNLLIPTFVLLALGALIQFILGPALVANQVDEFSVNYFFWRHLSAIIIGLIALYFGFKINLKHWLKYSPYILIGGIIYWCFSCHIGRWHGCALVAISGLFHPAGGNFENWALSW